MYDYWFPARYVELIRSVPEAERLANLQRMGESGDLHSIAVVASVVGRHRGDRRSRAVRRAAESALDSLLARVPSHYVGQLQPVLRSLCTWRAHGLRGRLRAWLRLRSTSYRRDGTWSLLAMHTCAGDGYQREAAVRALGLRDDASGLAFLVVRRNDWVEQVRAAAEEVTDHYLDMRHATAWARLLPLLDQLVRGGRAEHGPFVERVHRLLLDEPGRAALRVVVRDGDRITSRAGARLLASAADLDPEPLATAGDPIVRLALLRRLQADASALTPDLLRRLAVDRFTPVAAGALHLLARARDPAADELLRAALLSTRGVMRITAQFHLSATGEDVEAFYVEQLISGEEQPRVLAAALAGYAETTSSPDPDLVRSFLGHRTARVRRAALRALVRADRSDVATFVNALADDSPGVTKTAHAALWRRPRVVQVHDLAQLAADPREHVRRAADRLLGLRENAPLRGFRSLPDTPNPDVPIQNAPASE